MDNSPDVGSSSHVCTWYNDSRQLLAFSRKQIISYHKENLKIIASLNPIISAHLKEDLYFSAEHVLFLDNHTYGKFFGNGSREDIQASWKTMVEEAKEQGYTGVGLIADASYVIGRDTWDQLIEIEEGCDQAIRDVSHMYVTCCYPRRRPFFRKPLDPKIMALHDTVINPKEFIHVSPLNKYSPTSSLLGETDILPVALLAVKADGTVMDMNDQMSHLLGIDKNHLPASFSSLTKIPLEDTPLFFTLATGRELKGALISITNAKNNEDHFCHISTLVKSSKNKPEYIVAAFSPANVTNGKSSGEINACLKSLLVRRKYSLYNWADTISAEHALHLLRCLERNEHQTPVQICPFRHQCVFAFDEKLYLERRRYRRVTLSHSLNVYIQEIAGTTLPHEFSSKPLSAESTDISSGGLGLISQQPIPPEALVYIEFPYLEDALVLEGVVRWSQRFRSVYRTGIEFKNLTQKNQGFLFRLMFHAERNGKEEGEISPGQVQLLMFEKRAKNYLEPLLRIAMAKDPYTYYHDVRVETASVKLAKRLGLPSWEIALLSVAAYLHDIGKIEIDRSILCKPEPLSGEEFELVKQHPVWGKDILAQFEALHPIIPAVLHHHERYDGSGYPAGLAGKKIPFHARILAVADAIDAMASDRAYREKLTPEKIISELRRGIGTQFDPDLAELALEMIQEGELLTTDTSITQ